MKIEILYQSSDIDVEGDVTQKVLWMLTFPKGLIFLEAKFDKAESCPKPSFTCSSLVPWGDLPRLFTPFVTGLSGGTE